MCGERYPCYVRFKQVVLLCEELPDPAGSLSSSLVSLAVEEANALCGYTVFRVSKELFFT